MRKAFVDALCDIAAADDRVLLLTADIGFSVLEPFREKFSGRFFNVGVAEQNMIGMATGLAKSGFIPFVYSIATFSVLRPFEFIRNGPVHHQSKVRIVGVGGGFEYGTAGATHHALEDIGVLRSQPGLSIVVPFDDRQVRPAIRSMYDAPGPIYYRLSKNQIAIPGFDPHEKFNAVEEISAGDDILVIACGPIVKEAQAAALELKKRNVGCHVVGLAQVTPAPRTELARLLGKFKTAVTVETHYDVGGIGSLVSEIVAESGIPCRVIRCGIKPELIEKTGSESYLNGKNGLSVPELVRRIAGACAERSSIRS